jgi:hypothetical protein
METMKPIFTTVLVASFFLISSISCSSAKSEIDQFDFVLGDWERIFYSKAVQESSNLKCTKTDENEISCISTVTNFNDSVSYKVNYFIKKENDQWIIEIEEWGKVRYSVTFLLDTPRVTKYVIGYIDSTKLSGQKNTPFGKLGWLKVSNYEKDKLMILSDDTPHQSTPFHYRRVE